MFGAQLTNFSGAVIIVSHDRYFVDKIAKKLFIFKADKHIEESHQQYSEYLELEKEIRDLHLMEKEMKEKKPQELENKEKNKALKLTFKEKLALEKLPQEIEDLEDAIEKKNFCLSDPSCYEGIGITTLAKELSQLQKIYELKVEELLTIEEKQETIGK